jgi:hypothetical protein
VLEDGVLALAVLLEDVGIDADLLGDVLDDPRRHLGHVSERATRESEQSEAHCKAQTVDWSTVTIDDPQVAIRQCVEAAEITLGQIGGNAYERIPLLGGEQARGLGYHAAANSAGMTVKAGSGAGLANLSQ